MKLKHVLAPVLFAELLLHVNAAENILAGKSAIFEQLPAYNLPRMKMMQKTLLTVTSTTGWSTSINRVSAGMVIFSVHFTSISTGKWK